MYLIESAEHYGFTVTVYRASRIVGFAHLHSVQDCESFAARFFTS